MGARRRCRRRGGRGSWDWVLRGLGPRIPQPFGPPPFDKGGWFDCTRSANTFGFLPPCQRGVGGDLLQFLGNPLAHAFEVPHHLFIREPKHANTELPQCTIASRIVRN